VRKPFSWVMGSSSLTFEPRLSDGLGRTATLGRKKSWTDCLRDMNDASPKKSKDTCSTSNEKKHPVPVLAALAELPCPHKQDTETQSHGKNSRDSSKPDVALCCVEGRQLVGLPQDKLEPDGGSQKGSQRNVC
jgi:hypothetical protein